MLLWVACGFFVLAIAAATAGFCSHLPALDVHREPGYSPVDPKRYQALIQLLRNLDTDLPDDPQRRKIAKEEQHERIRAYLRALTIDYGRLLHELRLIVVRSQTDRPELIHTLEKNRTTFACAMCRIDLRLSLNRWRIGDAELLTKEVMTLVNGLRALQLRTRFVMESTAWGPDTVT